MTNKITQFFVNLRITLSLFLKLNQYIGFGKRRPEALEPLKSRVAREFLHGINLKVSNVKIPQHSGPLVVVSNHISYIDIPLMMYLLPKGCFVAKSAVGTWPIIGAAAKLAHTIFVHRSSDKSRAGALQQIREQLVASGKQVIIFPSGTTLIHPAQSWKRGAFSIAKDAGIPVMPVRIMYEPLRKMAYIDDDTLFTHLMDMQNLKNKQVHVEFGEIQYIQNPTEDCERIRKWCEALLPERVVM